MLKKTFFLHKKQELAPRESSCVCGVNKENLVEEIKKICDEMDKTEMWFQMEKDADLIEACIHQREVLNARYRYLMNRIKPEKIS